MEKRGLLNCLNAAISCVMYYDDKGQMIQRCSTTVFGKTDRELVAYNFVGNVTGRKIIHAKPGTGSAVCSEVITQHYDAMGRKDIVLAVEESVRVRDEGIRLPL